MASFRRMTRRVPPTESRRRAIGPLLDTEWILSGYQVDIIGNLHHELDRYLGFQTILFGIPNTFRATNWIPQGLEVQDSELRGGSDGYQR